MTRQAIPVPFAEWAPDASNIAGFARDAKGVISSAGHYAPLPDLTPLIPPSAPVYLTDEFGSPLQGNDGDPITIEGGGNGSAISGICLGGGGFWDTSSTPHIFLADETDLYKLLAKYPTVVSKAGGYSPDTSKGWQLEQFGNFIVAVAGNVSPQVYELGSSSLFANLGGSPPLSTSVFRIGYQLALCTGRTMSVSGFNDITNWLYETATQGVQVDLDQRGGNIQCGVGGEVGLIFMERAIVRATYIGPPTVLQLDTIEWKHGAISGDAVSTYGRRVFFASETGFHVTDGLTVQPIGQNKVDQYFVDNLNYSARNRVTTAIDYAKKLWMVAFPSAGRTTPDKLLIYSIADNRWTYDEIEVQHLMEMPKEGVTLDDLAGFLSLENTIVVDEISTGVDDPQWRETRTQVGAVDSIGRLGTFEGSNRPATLTTSEFEAIKLKQTNFDELWPMVDIGTVSDLTGSIETRRNHQGEALASSTAAMNQWGFVPVLVNGRFARMGVSIASGATWTEATGMQWRGSAAGER